jgi:hypothetical protein
LIDLSKPLNRPAKRFRLNGFDSAPQVPGNRSFGCLRLPSPSRHIYNALTIAFAFRRLGAFDGFWQRPIKVDGTFA